ncbi:MAG: prephenate dehydratase [Candidatus Omnitrophica bacterium]|nr:prephenate dehydratase [Candidatus Omnitrophota bacterium]
MSKKKILSLRLEIDSLDEKIVKLLNKRALAGKHIGGVKEARNAPIYSPGRENQVYSNIKSLNKGPLPFDALKPIYAEIMSACRNLEKPLKIAYLGPEFTFSHQAVLKKFGSSVETLAADSIPEVFLAVENGNADYGVVPIENSIEGAVNYTMDMFVNSEIVICAEEYCKIRQNLLSKETSLKNVRSVLSIPPVFGQCKGWLEKNLPHVRLKDTVSTAKAAEMVASMRHVACIASELAARRYKLNILARSIHDSSYNVTRFLVLGKKMHKSSGNDKTSILFSVQDKPGILHEMLSSFRHHNINLNRIESRPSKLEAWKYYFFIDIDGHVDDEKVKKALGALKNKCNFLKILGSYPKG